MDQIQGFLPIILLFFVMYLFLIRPQMKRQKQEKTFAKEIKNGDKIVTNTLSVTSHKISYEFHIISWFLEKQIKWTNKVISENKNLF